MESQADPHPQYPIGVVAQRTGLSTHVLRAWERRYGAVEPGRGRNGARLYSNADIVRLRLLRRVTDAGHPISRVAPLDTERLVALVREEEAARTRGDAPRASPGADRFVTLCLEAVESMDGRRIRALLMRAVVGLGLMEFVEGGVTPLLRRVGELWEGGDLCPAHEHLLSACVHHVLHWLLDTLPSDPDAPLLLATTPAGQRHELGAMLAGVVAADAGWRTVYFGPDLPAHDVARAVAATGARAVALSAVYVPDSATAAGELAALRLLLPGDVLLLAGGPGVERERERLEARGVTCLPDFAALRVALRSAAGLPQED